MIVKLNLSGHPNAELEAQGFIYPGALHVDLGDPDLPIKVVNFLKPLVANATRVYIALPGLAPLASIVLVALHGLTGFFPIVVPLIRTENGFVPGPSLDLQSLRNDIARTARDGIVNI